MATAKEINNIVDLLVTEANTLFKRKGLKIKIDDNIDVLPQSKMECTNANGVYSQYYNRIQLRRALIGDIVDSHKCNPNLQIQKLYDFKTALKVLIHERGHQLHKQILNWQVLDVDYVCSYGKKNYKEAFAVAFQEYITENYKYHNKLVKILNDYNLLENEREVV